MIGRIVLSLGTLVATITAQAFNPTMTIDSCTQSSLVISLTDAADGGITYIQGQGAACKQNTAVGTNQHTFDFGACGIQWESTFKLIVQKKSLYQTGDDKQIPVMCVADLGDLTVDSNLNAADKDDDAGQNKTVKPTATMTLFKDGSDISGGTVQLTDIVTMILQLDAEYIQDFDIKAKDCTASTIDITTSSCAAEPELFPHFTHTSQGILTATFGAFRTTDLNGGAVGMPFSCTMQVCLGSCSHTACGDGNQGWGRKKRQDSEDTGFEDIAVGSTISITTEEVVIEDPADNGEMCMNQGAFVAIVIMMVGGLVATTILSIVMFKKLQEKTSILKKLAPGGQMTSVSVPIA